ncbi:MULTISPECIES: hypothetical protein [unclassified Nocardia]|uniref:hypothetical protein n=1 Tax=unclassified Nocardia TaxID=2637762 RepID=UPI001CE42DC3|nr:MULTISPECIES: hypothetical protein [unclassified Nocardia]
MCSFLAEVIDRRVRRGDERILEVAIGMVEAQVPGQERWWPGMVGGRPRWRLAQVSPDNARERLAESRNGIRYAADGHRLLPRGMRRTVRESLRNAERSGDAESVARLRALLSEGLPPPEDWQSPRPAEAQDARSS